MTRNCLLGQDKHRGKLVETPINQSRSKKVRAIRKTKAAGDNNGIEGWRIYAV